MKISFTKKILNHIDNLLEYVIREFVEYRTRQIDIHNIFKQEMDIAIEHHLKLFELKNITKELIQNELNKIDINDVVQNEIDDADIEFIIRTEIDDIDTIDIASNIIHNKINELNIEDMINEKIDEMDIENMINEKIYSTNFHLMIFKYIVKELGGINNIKKMIINKVNEQIKEGDIIKNDQKL